jgi:signal transduction histidine kinase/Tfp pilus assembly protein PilF
VKSSQRLFSGNEVLLSRVYQYFLNIRAIVLPLLLLLSGSVFSQNAPIDSLLKFLPNSRDAERADILYELAYEYIIVDVEQALTFSKASYSTAKDIGDSLRMVRAGRLMTSAFRRLEKIDSSIYAGVEAVEIASRNGLREEAKILYNSVAMAYSLKAEYDRALDYHFKSLVAREEGGNKSEISIALNNIGFVYFKLKNYEKALEYFEQSIALKREVNDKYDLDGMLINVGLCNIQLKKFQQALIAIMEGLSICGENCSDELVIEAEFGQGVANFGLEKFTEAERHFNKSLDLARRIENRRFQAENLVYLGRVYLKGNQFEKAQSYLSEAEAIAILSGYNQVRMDMYREFSNLYTLNEDFQQASFYQNKYIALKDSLISEELVKNIAKIQTQFEERKNIATIAEREESLTRQRMLNFAIGIIGGLSVLLVFVLYRSNVTRQRVNARLTEAKAIIEQKNGELEIRAKNLKSEVDKATADLVVVNEALRKVNGELDNFIYKTSHDIRGPLSSLQGVCNVALLDVKDPLALDYLTKLNATATRLNSILTRMMVVNQVNNATIIPAIIKIEQVVNELELHQRKKGIPSGLVFKRDIQPDIAFQSDDNLIRIILTNLLDNAIKFYNDFSTDLPFVLTKVWVDIMGVHIHVIDNGLGLSETDPEKIFQMFSRASERSATGGLGLYLIKRAAGRLHGQVGLRKTPEGFTEFMVTLPLEIPEFEASNP